MKKLILSIVLLMFYFSLSYAGHPTFIEVTDNADVFTSTITVGNGDLSVENKIIHDVPKFNPTVDYIAPEASDVDVFISTFTGINLNHELVRTTLLTTATTYTLAGGSYADIITPRNICAVIRSTAIATGGYNHQITVISVPLVVTGINSLGEADTETITISTHSMTSPTEGNKAWLSITSLALGGSGTITFASGASCANVTVAIGTKNKIGLPFDLTYASEIKKVLENKAVSTTYSVNTTYDTIDFATDPNATINYQIYAKPHSR